MTTRILLARQALAIAVALVIVGCDGNSQNAAPTTTRTTTTTAVADTTTTFGRAIETSISYRSGLMRLDPSDAAKATVSAREALSATGGAQPGDAPQLLLGRLTVFDYTIGLHRLIDHRLVWLVVYNHHALPDRGGCGGLPIPGKPVGGCRAQVGTVLIPVDARTGAPLGTWFYSAAQRP
jgi:hypothetical protein